MIFSVCFFILVLLQTGVASGSQLMSKEQESLVRRGPSGQYSSEVDILVTTPGRLLEHLAVTPGFTLKHVRFLVIDEADRLLSTSADEWLRKVWLALEQTAAQV